MEKRIQCRIEGTTPLLCNRFTEAAQQSATSGTTTSTVGDKGSPQEIAVQKLYLDADETPCIPQPNVFRAILDAGKFFKAGKSKVTTQKSSLIPSCLDVEGVMFPIYHQDPWTVDTRPVRIPSTGGRVLSHRPCFNDWALEFEMTLDTTVMSAKLLREIVDKSGKAIGLGDYRPDCKGPFGKFVVTKWDVKNGDQ